MLTHFHTLVLLEVLVSLSYLFLSTTEALMNQVELTGWLTDLIMMGFFCTRFFHICKRLERETSYVKSMWYETMRSMPICFVAKNKSKKR